MGPGLSSRLIDKETKSWRIETRVVPSSSSTISLSVDHSLRDDRRGLGMGPYYHYWFLSQTRQSKENYLFFFFFRKSEEIHLHQSSSRLREVYQRENGKDLGIEPRSKIRFFLFVGYFDGPFKDLHNNTLTVGRSNSLYL